jgi:uncharacterized membrane protein YgdD (TMEM256/DUF423 family)
MNWIAAGAALAGIGVVLGAFGAHALAEQLAPEQLETWRTAVLYQLVHALALILFGLFDRARDAGATAARGGGAAGWCFLTGTLAFSGSLYLLVLGGPRWVGPVTPAGGLLLVAGWALFAARAWRERALP